MFGRLWQLRDVSSLGLLPRCAAYIIRALNDERVHFARRRT